MDRSVLLAKIIGPPFLAVGLGGWLLLVGGIVRIVLPDMILKLGSTIYGSPTTLLIVAIISLVLGGFLSFKGYWTSK